MKKFKRNIRNIISIILAVVLMTTSLVFAEINENGATSEIHPRVLSEEMEKKEDIALIKYNKLLEVWAKDPRYVDDNDANFPDFFGGSYIDDDKNLVIQVTSDEEYVIEYFKRIINLDNTYFEKVSYPYSALIAAKNQITNIMNQKTDDELIASIKGTGIRVRDNAVSIHFYGEVIGDREIEIRNEVREKVTAFPGVVLIDNSGKSVPTASTLQPGFKITASGERSIGFWAYDSSGNIGIVTAAHLFPYGGDAYISNVQFGTCTARQYYGNVDAAFVKRTNTYYTPSQFVFGWGFTLQSNATTLLNAGATVYAKGFKTGTFAGNVVEVSYTTDQGITNCILTDAMCRKGDSGGVVAGGGNSTQRYLAGIIIAKVQYWNQTDSDPGEMIYCKASNILSALSLTVY